MNTCYDKMQTAWHKKVDRCAHSNCEEIGQIRICHECCSLFSVPGTNGAQEYYEEYRKRINGFYNGKKSKIVEGDIKKKNEQPDSLLEKERGGLMSKFVELMYKYRYREDLINRINNFDSIGARCEMYCYHETVQALIPLIQELFGVDIGKLPDYQSNQTEETK